MLLSGKVKMSEKSIEPNILVIAGVIGNLAYQMLFPSIYHLYHSYHLYQ